MTPHHTGSDRTPEMDQVMPDSHAPEERDKLYYAALELYYAALEADKLFHDELVRVYGKNGAGDARYYPKPYRDERLQASWMTWQDALKTWQDALKEWDDAHR